MKAFVINVIGDIGLVLRGDPALQASSGRSTTWRSSSGPPSSSRRTSGRSSRSACCCWSARSPSRRRSRSTPGSPTRWRVRPRSSALIHAATMVTAGVYLIARCLPALRVWRRPPPTSPPSSASRRCSSPRRWRWSVTDLKRIIAYSTMSQIGYMIIGVSIGAYTGGLFHLMTHAFFKALLFMAAGSVIAAMANNQNIDEMGGFRKAMPFTFVLMTIGALALAAFPGTSGLLLQGRDPRLCGRPRRHLLVVCDRRLHRRRSSPPSTRSGSSSASSTASRARRRASSEQGSLAHGEPVNPHTGEAEDNDVGFPGRGAPHRRAQLADASWRWCVLGLGALFAGYIQVPGVDAVLEHFLEPVFEDSPLFSIVPSTLDSWIGLAVGSVLSIAGIGLAYYLYIVAPGSTARILRALPGSAPAAVQQVLLRRAPERARLQAADGDRPVREQRRRALRRAGHRRRRPGKRHGARRHGQAAQSGFIRSYALFVIAGLVGLALYFLIAAS